MRTWALVSLTKCVLFLPDFFFFFFFVVMSSVFLRIFPCGDRDTTLGYITSYVSE